MPLSGFSGISHAPLSQFHNPLHSPLHLSGSLPSCSFAGIPILYARFSLNSWGVILPGRASRTSVDTCSGKFHFASGIQTDTFIRFLTGFLGFRRYSGYFWPIRQIDHPFIPLVFHWNGPLQEPDCHRTALYVVFKTRVSCPGPWQRRWTRNCCISCPSRTMKKRLFNSGTWIRVESRFSPQEKKGSGVQQVLQK